MAHLLAAIRTRILGLLRRRGVLAADDAMGRRWLSTLTAGDRSIMEQIMGATAESVAWFPPISLDTTSQSGGT